jgi:hypothetical protein
MNTTKKLLGVGATLLVMLFASISGLAGPSMSTPPAHADPDQAFHQVTYTVSAKNPTYTDIFYQDQDPTLFSDYSHNNYAFTPQVHADIAPGKPWVQVVPMLDPNQWAMVSVTAGREPGIPQFHCDLAVDGVVVVSKDGPRGVLCSLRTW